jgi:hypothetical protein
MAASVMLNGREFFPRREKRKIANFMAADFFYAMNRNDLNFDLEMA